MLRAFRFDGAFLFLLLLFVTGQTSGFVKPSDVIYGIVPPFFGSQPLRAVTQRLGYLRELGVDIIWLSPLQKTDDIGAINYSVTDYFKLREDFGTEEDLKKLVKEAHLLGIKVIIDFVPNHSSQRHPFFVDSEKHGTASVFYDFYQRDKNGNYEFYFNWDDLPNFNYKNPQVVRMMEDAFIHWMTNYDLDGFRIDVAWGVKERAPDFWLQLRRRLEAINPDVILLAEASVLDPYYSANGFDLAYDWGHDVGHWAWKDVFQDTTGLSGRLNRALHLSNQPSDKTLRFLNNNDTGRRFVTRYGVEMTKIAATLQFTLPGAALLYTGDEVGAEYKPYDDPPPVKWTDTKKLRPYYRRLAELREALPALSEKDFFRLPTSDEGAIYAYLRGSGASQILVVLNFGRTKNFEIDLNHPRISSELRTRLSAAAAAGTFVDVIMGASVRAVQGEGGFAQLPLSSRRAFIF